MEVTFALAVALLTRLVLPWSWVRVVKLRVLVMENCEASLLEDEKLVCLLSCPKL